MDKYAVRKYISDYKGNKLLILIKPYAPLATCDKDSAFVDLYYKAHQELYLYKKKLINDGLCEDIDLLYKDMLVELGMAVRLKNQLTYIKEFGSFFTVSAVKLLCNESLIDGVLPLPVTKDYPCNNCNICMRACPTKALDGKGGYNRDICIRELQSGILPENSPYRKAIGNRVLGCNNCQLACPVNAGIAHAKYSDLEAEHFNLDNFRANLESGKSGLAWYEGYVGNNFARKMRFLSFIDCADENRNK